MLAAGGWRLTFARVYDRVFELLLVAAVVIIWRRLDLGTPRQLGLARPRWAVVGLFGLGLLLAVARLRTGSLWVSIGIHAAWVSVFRVGRLFFAIRHEPVWLIGPGWPPLVGGVAGWLAIAVAAGVLWSRGRRAIRGG